ncbi:hypothetical protein [Paenibacillus terrae]|uniref:hypothetical protein n=1 Tax=Paenibacillus terrae TaxID=159743 RepID=UPI000B03D4EF|nr:hypothetical protein [Paenibacillus terrae]
MDLHGNHCLFVNIEKHHPECGASIEAYLLDTQVIDEVFLLHYVNTSPEAAVYAPVLREMDMLKCASCSTGM